MPSDRDAHAVALIHPSWHAVRRNLQNWADRLVAYYLSLLRKPLCRSNCSLHLTGCAILMAPGWRFCVSAVSNRMQLSESLWSAAGVKPEPTRGGRAVAACIATSAAPNVYPQVFVTVYSFVGCFRRCERKKGNPPGSGPTNVWVGRVRWRTHGIRQN